MPLDAEASVQLSLIPFWLFIALESGNAIEDFA
jgi:hypothetical protein